EAPPKPSSCTRRPPKARRAVKRPPPCARPAPWAWRPMAGRARSSGAICSASARTHNEPRRLDGRHFQPRMRSLLAGALHRSRDLAGGRSTSVAPALTHTLPSGMPMLDSDYTQRFLFDDTDVRGEWVGLERSYVEVLAKHPYPEPVAQLLGELLAAAALLVGTLKFDGLLVLQARSAGAVPLLMVVCSSEREVRGIARYHEEQLTPGATLAELMPEGVLAMTIDPANGQRYQGIVALDGIDLADSLSNYFASSEQLPTRVWLNADGRRPSGMLLQQLPADRIRDGEARAAAWQ